MIIQSSSIWLINTYDKYFVTTPTTNNHHLENNTAHIMVQVGATCNNLMLMNIFIE